MVGVPPSVTQERWEKLQARIRWIGQELNLSDGLTSDTVSESNKAGTLAKPTDGLINFKSLESCVGFINYVAMCYGSLVPYLKGIYLTLNAWRPGRDEHGWTSKALKDIYRASGKRTQSETPPVWVKIIPRLRGDILALMWLTNTVNPPSVPIRPSSTKACFMVGDASGVGPGSSCWIQGDDFIEASYGAWKDEVTRTKSSNFRETANLVRQVRRKVKNGSIERGSEVFVFTDNSTAERTMYKGSSTSSQ